MGFKKKHTDETWPQKIYFLLLLAVMEFLWRYMTEKKNPFFKNRQCMLYLKLFENEQNVNILQNSHLGILHTYFSESSTGQNTSETLF